MAKRNKKDIYVESTRAIDKLIESSEKQVDKEFIALLKGIKSTLASAYEKFGRDGILTREEMVKYGRLTKLEQSLIEQIQKLNKNQIRLTKDTIQHVFEESYYRYGYLIENETEFRIYELLSKEAINQNIHNDLNPISWDKRVKINNETMLRQLVEDINQALIVGSSYAFIASMVADRVTVGSNKGKRIVRYEGRRVQEKANFDSMDKADEVISKAGMQVKKQWLSAKDSRVRHTHRGLDGQTIDIDDEFTSPSGAKAKAPRQFGIPKEDANCRCMMIHAFYDEDGNRIGGRTMRARNNGDNQIGIVVPYQKYTDWKKSLENR